MRAKLFVMAGMMLSIFFLAAGTVISQEKVSGSEWTQIVEQIGDKGRVNWSQGYIEAVGIGAPPEKYYGKPQARPLALRAATLDAYRNLLEVTNGVRIDSKTTVRDFAVESDVINSQVEGLVKGAKEVKKEYLSDGTVEVTVRMPLAGEFLQVIIPRVMKRRPVEPPRPVEPAPAAPASQDPAASTPTAPVPAVQPASAPAAPAAEPASAAPASPPPVYTGMVVDARGLQARPAMSPKIIDESGKEVYGTTNVDRDYAVQQGMSGYARDLTAAQSNQRVTNSPISVKGLKTDGPGRSDIIISDADAQLIRSSADTNFLKKCRVMIVLD